MTSEFPFSRSAVSVSSKAQVIARMQTDGRFVENVKHAAQIRTELRRESDPLRFAAAQCFRRTAEREITEPDVLHETKPLLNFRHKIRRDCLLRSAKAQFADQLQRFARGKRGEIIDRMSLANARVAQSDSNASHDMPDKFALPLHRSTPIRARPRVHFPKPIRHCLRCQFVISDSRFHRTRRILRTRRAAN